MCSSSSTITSRPSLASDRPRARSAALVVVAASLVGCAHAIAPADRDARTLYRDLERQVTVTETTGWGPDKLEIDGLVKDTLDSTCRVDPLARRELTRWLDGEIRLRGGSVEEMWRFNGKDLSRVSELLTLVRIQKLLARAEELAPECPFWVEVERPFRGRQISEGTFQIVAGGGGQAIAVHQGDRDDFSAGGAGRILAGYAFEGGTSAYLGLELGASAAFPKDETGERAALVIGVDVVAPIVVRRTFTNTYFEVEGGYLARANESDWGRIDSGFHVGFAFGGRALRQRFVFPGAAIAISYDQTFEDKVSLIKVGGRVTFDLDL